MRYWNIVWGTSSRTRITPWTCVSVIIITYTSEFLNWSLFLSAVRRGNNCTALFHCTDLWTCRFGKMVNKEFRTIMFFQFCTSLSMICCSFYRTMQMEVDSSFIGMIFMICALMQIFYYCWFSNEVKLKVRFITMKSVYPTVGFSISMNLLVLPLNLIFLFKCIKTVRNRVFSSKFKLN